MKQQFTFYNVHTSPLSNFYPAGFTINDLYYPTAEHYYQSKKFEGTQKQVQIRKAVNIQAAHLLGQTYGVTFDNEKWMNIREKVYADAMRYKFQQNKGLAEKLIETGDREIINIDDDIFWGMKYDENEGKMTGENKTGKILMKIREELRHLQNNIEQKL